MTNGPLDSKKLITALLQGWDEQRLTRTSAAEMFETDGILMTAVDTGWITDERPHHTKVRLAEEGFHAPLDLVDGAARVYDPIVRGESGDDVHGVFLKDYLTAQW